MSRTPITRVTAMASAVVFSVVLATQLQAEPVVRFPENPTPWPTVNLPPMTPVPTRPLTAPEEPPAVTVEPVPTVHPDSAFHLMIFASRFPNTAISEYQATIIAIGSVKQILAPRWSTPDGRRPPNPHAPDIDVSIYTPVLIEIEEYLKGEQQQQQLVFFAVGGTVGPDSVEYMSDDIHEFRVGDRVLVFAGSFSHAADHRPVYYVLERYTLTADGQASNSLRTATVDQLRSEIRDAMQR